MIEILSQSALATVQDLGRFGALRWGVGTAGAMDRLALACGNLLLGNAEGAAAIEVQVFPFEVRFDADRAFALTGADCAATLDGVPLLPWSARQARGRRRCCASACRRPARWRGRAGLSLRRRRHRRARWCSARAARSFAARSAASKAARCGRATGCRRAAPPGVPRRSASASCRPALALPLEARRPAGRAGAAGRRIRRLHARPRATRFWAEPWKITPQSDRYGFRLAGPSLEPMAPMEMRSHGIVPGVIQVPHGGQPIVQMCDAQPSGGYPKIGTVIEADLWRLGQAPIGSRIRFVEATGTRRWRPRDEARRHGSPRSRRAARPAPRRGGRRDDDAAGSCRRDRRLAGGDRHRRAGADRARRPPARCGAAASPKSRRAGRGDGAGAEVETVGRGSPSPGIGVFLHAHPLHDDAAGRRRRPRGARARRSACCRIGALLLPVPAPRDGIVAALVAQDGALVGYGDPLFDFLPHD